MGIFDEIKKLTHPGYEDEDDDFEEFEVPAKKEVFESRPKLEERRNKVVNIHATTQLKVPRKSRLRRKSRAARQSRRPARSPDSRMPRFSRLS